MFIDGRYIDENEIVGNEKKFIKKHNNIYISDEQINILNTYNINIDNY